MHPLSRAKAQAFWRDVVDGVGAQRTAALLVAEDATASSARLNWC